MDLSYPELVLGGLLVLAFAVPGSVVLWQVKRGRPFSVLVMHSLVFLLEFALGAVLATGALEIPLRDSTRLARAMISRALAICVGGYIVFLLGYTATSALSSYRARRSRPRGYVAGPAFNRWLWIATLFTVACGLMSLVLKARFVGGFDVLFSGFYRYRFGALALTANDNAMLTAVEVLAAQGRGFIGMAIYVLWAQRRSTLWRHPIWLAVLGCYMISQLALALRAALLSVLFGGIAVYYIQGRIRRARLLRLAAIGLFATVVATHVHLYVFYRTANWKPRTFSESALSVVASSKVFENLAAIMSRNEAGAQPLGTQGLVENFFFFVPRAFWHGKSNMYGSLLTAKWAGLPVYYQVAVSDVGECVARFGLFGIVAMALYGIRAAMYDKYLHSGGPEVQVGICALVLPRVFSDVLMGLSSCVLTFAQLIVFVLAVRLFRLFSEERGTATSRVFFSPGLSRRLRREPVSR